jgi:hypothetical protein
VEYKPNLTQLDDPTLDPREVAERRAAVAEAIAWFGVPFHNNQCSPDGTDCGGIILGVFNKVLGKTVTLPRYSYQHGLNQTDDEENELYEKALREHCAEVAVPLPGDIALFRLLLNHPRHHAAIVVSWPHEIIHAYQKYVTLADPTREGRMRRALRHVKFFSPWRKP